MYIDKQSSALLTTLQNYSKSKIGTLADAIESENSGNSKKNSLSDYGFTGSSLTSGISSSSLSETSSMSSLEKYKYMLEQGKSTNNLNSIVTDPEGTLEKANEVIKKATETGSNISNDELLEALIIRQQCQGKLDVSA